jgi:hypothetical protein
MAESTQALVSMINEGKHDDLRIHIRDMDTAEASLAIYTMSVDVLKGCLWRFPVQNLSLIHIAAAYDDLEAFVFLLSKGVDIRQPSGDNWRAIHYAVSMQSREVALYILEHDPKCAEVIFATERQLLYLAALVGDPEIMGKLLGCRPTSPA